MTINISFISVVYSFYRPDDDEPEIAHKCKGELNIYNGRVTSARIAQAIPKGATVDRIHKINYRFDVDGEKALAWLIENGEIKE